MCESENIKPVDLSCHHTPDYNSGTARMFGQPKIQFIHFLKSCCSHLLGLLSVDLCICRGKASDERKLVGELCDALEQRESESC